MRLRILLAFATISLCDVPASFSQTICVLDSTLAFGGEACGPGVACINVHSGTFSRAYIMATPGGITGAEFFVGNWPFWQTTVVTPNPAASIVLGNPVRSTPGSNVPFYYGVNIAFPVCQAGSPWILLFTLDYYAAFNINTSCRPVAHSQPSNANFTCPLVVMCNDPVFTAVCTSSCVTTISAYPPVGVETSSWSRMKSLYD